MLPSKEQHSQSQPWGEGTGIWWAAAAVAVGRCMLHRSRMYLMCCLEVRSLLNCHGKTC